MRRERGVLHGLAHVLLLLGAAAGASLHVCLWRDLPASARLCRAPRHDSGLCPLRCRQLKWSPTGKGTIAFVEFDDVATASYVHQAMQVRERGH